MPAAKSVLSVSADITLMGRVAILLCGKHNFDREHDLSLPVVFVGMEKMKNGLAVLRALIWQ